jgi:hypothetical protein
MEEEQAVPVEETAQEVVEEPKETKEEKTEEVVETKAEEVVEPPKPKKSAQERFDELTRKRRDAEREAEFWKAKALQKEVPAPEAPVTTPIPKRPTLDQFETTEQYEDALFEWRDKKKEIETRTAKTQEDLNQAERTFQERARKIREQHEDFDEVIENPVFSPAMKLALLKSENGPEVAYHLGRPENRETADRILAMPAEMQIYELGRLETKLLLAQQTKKVPSAPPPIKPVGMTGAGTEPDPSKMTMDEWVIWDKQQTEANLRKKKPWLFPK